MNDIYIGKIVNTHGLKGEVRMLCSFKYKDRVFVCGFPIYIGKERKLEKIVHYRPHKQFDMICLEGYTNINDVLKYKGQKVYVKREDLSLREGEYLNQDLIGCEVIYGGQSLGKCRDILSNGFSEMLVVRNLEKKVLIPYVDAFVWKIDLEEKKIYVREMKGLVE